MDNFDSFITFEVKKEIADRYFGFRRIIEKDTKSYLKKILTSSLELENKIGHDLVQIYTLLNDETLRQSFLSLTGLPERLFVDSHINTSPKKETICYLQKPRGFTRKGCLQNMFFDTYRNLFKHVEEYRDVLKQLSEDHETIREQINLFYQKNDITSILQFLRSLENTSMEHSPPAFDTTGGADLEKKMRIHPPLPATELLPEIPAVPPEKSIHKQLKKLIMKACEHQPQLDIRYFKNRQ
jgi:hypothetical protein